MTRVVAVAAILSWLSPLASAAPLEAEPEQGPKYRNEAGSLVLSGGLGIGVGGRTTVVSIGAGVGYAPITGILPGVRGRFLASRDVAGELAATLTLTPPLSSYLLPFVFGEAGRRFDSAGGGWLYGGGGGVYLGDADAPFSLQVGWVFRQIEYEDVGGEDEDVVLDASGPLIALSLAF